MNKPRIWKSHDGTYAACYYYEGRYFKLYGIRSMKQCFEAVIRSKESVDNLVKMDREQERITNERRIGY